jgi:hypothetical protein
MCVEGNEKDNHELSRALCSKRDEISNLEAELRCLKEGSDGISCEIDHLH